MLPIQAEPMRQVSSRAPTDDSSKFTTMDSLFDRAYLSLLADLTYAEQTYHAYWKTNVPEQLGKAKSDMFSCHKDIHSAASDTDRARTETELNAAFDVWKCNVEATRESIRLESLLMGFISMSCDCSKGSSFPFERCDGLSHQYSIFRKDKLDRASYKLSQLHGCMEQYRDTLLSHLTKNGTSHNVGANGTQMVYSQADSQAPQSLSADQGTAVPCWHCNTKANAFSKLNWLKDKLEEGGTELRSLDLDQASGYLYNIFQVHEWEHRRSTQGPQHTLRQNMLRTALFNWKAWKTTKAEMIEGRLSSNFEEQRKCMRCNIVPCASLTECPQPNHSEALKISTVLGDTRDQLARLHGYLDLYCTSILCESAESSGVSAATAAQINPEPDPSVRSLVMRQHGGYKAPTIEHALPDYVNPALPTIKREGRRDHEWFPL